MKILVSGGTGFVGSAVVPRLRAAGQDVRLLTRSKRSAADPDVAWEPQTGEVDTARLNAWGGPEAAVHLAGENIASGRWTQARRERIRNSRVQATERLADSLLKLQTKPRVFVSASAVGYYGDRGEEVVIEESAPGEGFLSDVTMEWENAAEAFRRAGVRVVHLRFGMILDREGGALKKILPVFRAGLGGRLGSGRQWVSWVSRNDVARMIEFVLANESCVGAYNAVAPAPVRNAEFTRELARAVRRPAILPVPAFALRLALGEMADELLLSSTRVLPARFLAAGFQFEHPALRDALALLGG